MIKKGWCKTSAFLLFSHELHKWHQSKNYFAEGKYNLYLIVLFRDIRVISGQPFLINGNRKTTY
jgi:hypothetical protein